MHGLPIRWAVQWRWRGLVGWSIHRAIGMHGLPVWWAVWQWHSRVCWVWGPQAARPTQAAWWRHHWQHARRKERPRPRRQLSDYVALTDSWLGRLLWRRRRRSRACATDATGTQGILRAVIVHQKAAANKRSVGDHQTPPPIPATISVCPAHTVLQQQQHSWHVSATHWQEIYSRTPKQSLAAHVPQVSMSLLPPLPGALVLLHPICLSCRLVSYRIPQHGVAQVNLLAHALKPAASSRRRSGGPASTT